MNNPICFFEKKIKSTNIIINKKNPIFFNFLIFIYFKKIIYCELINFCNY